MASKNPPLVRTPEDPWVGDLPMIGNVVKKAPKKLARKRPKGRRKKGT